MSSGTIGVWPVATALDDNGAVLPGALLYSWLAGTSTPVFLYQDADLTITHDWPAQFDADGRLVYFMGPLSYKLELRDADDVNVWGPVDLVPSTGISMTLIGGSGFHFGGDASAPITATSYPTGATYEKTHAGSSVFNIDSARLGGTYALEVMILATGGATVSVSIVNLSDGAPDTPLATVTSTSTTGERKRTATITFAAAGAAKDYAIKVKVDTGAGFAWGAQLIKTS